MKTVISHFYNEEYLLPWWLNHHKNLFDNGIMINYHSTDNSCDIIKEICPHWQIVNTKNEYFDSAIIDREVEYYEKKIYGWRICLNITEFLVGDYSIIDSIVQKNKQILVGNYIFVDNEKESLDTSKQLYEQLFFGFFEDDPHAIGKVHIGHRPNRSLHNSSIRYPIQGGRHFSGPILTKNLIIFYYAYLLKIKEMINRKVQIQTKMSNREYNRFKNNHPNIVTEDTFCKKILTHQYHRCQNIKSEVDRIINLQTQYVNNKNNYISLL